MTRRNPQRGSAMLVTLILIAALLAGVAILVSLQLTSTKSTELTRNGLASLHCAEAGLAISHSQVASQRPLVNTHLNSYPNSTTQRATFLDAYFATATPNMSDIDGDGTANDFEIYIVDDADETPAPDYQADINSRVWLISRCVKWPDSPKEVRELVEFAASPTQYDWQDGRSFGNNNANTIQ